LIPEKEDRHDPPRHDAVGTVGLTDCEIEAMRVH
jgi:hypothetical protein